MKKVLFYVCPLAIFFAFLISCQIGLGKEVDLEAPIITLTKMQSGSTEVDSSHFGGGVYCKKTVSFFGKATDNVKVESVNAEIKWNNEVDFQRSCKIHNGIYLSWRAFVSSCLDDKLPGRLAVYCSAFHSYAVYGNHPLCKSARAS